MAVANELTQSAWILETNTGDKLGIVSYNPETESYLLISSDMEVPFTTWDELGTLLGEKVKISARKLKQAEYNNLEGFAVFHETVTDVQKHDNGWISYKATERSKKRFYAGFWLTPNAERTAWLVRAAIQTSLYETFTNEGYDIVGPEMDKMELTFMAKQRTTDMGKS